MNTTDRSSAVIAILGTALAFGVVVALTGKASAAALPNGGSSAVVRDKKKRDNGHGGSPEKQAAENLAAYLRKHDDFGSKKKPSQTVKRYQARMGKITADGIVGPKTRARAAALNVKLPDEWNVQVLPAHVIDVHADTPPSHQLPAPPPAPPAPVSRPAAVVQRQPASKPPAHAAAPAPTTAPQVAAEALAVYLRRTNDFGSKKKPSAEVKAHQRDMGKISADGIVGPKTRARAHDLGVTLPQDLPAPSPAAAPKAAQPKAAAPKAAPAAHAASPAPKAAAQPAKRTATQAANELYTYVTATVRAGNGDTLGKPHAPNKTVLEAQRDMRGLVTDGIYGPKTRARGKELTGREFPAREYTPPRRSAVDAANALLSYLNQGGAQGTKAAPASTVRDAQRDMGELTADGIYGPMTAKRGAALTSKAFPARHA
jgi:hypothetical protein